MNANPPAARDGFTRFVIFELSGVLCAVDALRVFEITGNQRVKEIPESSSAPARELGPDYVGYIDLRGEMIPVVDLNEKLNLGAPEKKDSAKIIITDVNGEKTGFTVNSVREIMLCDESRMRDIPPLVKNSCNVCLKSILLANGAIVFVVEPDMVLQFTPGIHVCVRPADG